MDRAEVQVEFSSTFNPNLHHPRLSWGNPFLVIVRIHSDLGRVYTAIKGGHCAPNYTITGRREYGRNDWYGNNEG